MSDRQWILLLITIIIIYKLAKWTEEDAPSSRPPTPPFTDKKEAISPPKRETLITKYD